MGREVNVIYRKDLEELQKKIDEIGKVIRGLIGETRYIFTRILRVLEDQKMLSYHDSYCIRVSLDELLELEDKLDKISEAIEWVEK